MNRTFFALIFVCFLLSGCGLTHPRPEAGCLSVTDSAQEPDSPSEPDASPQDASTDTVLADQLSADHAPSSVCPDGPAFLVESRLPTEVWVPTGDRPEVDIPIAQIATQCDLMVTAASFGFDDLLRAVNRYHFMSGVVLNIVDTPSGAYTSFLTSGMSNATLGLSFTFWSTAFGPVVLDRGVSGLVSLHLYLVPQPAGTRLTFQVQTQSPSTLTLLGNVGNHVGSEPLLSFPDERTDPGRSFSVTLVYP